MKRTLALLLSVIMVFGMIPMSLITALAHGPGVGKNDITNQSITNALNQAIPEVVVVDGDYTDTAWDKDEWLEADKRFGVWDVADPLALSFSYKYQVKLDAEYLYGVFQLANSSADEIVLWLNDGSNSGKCSDIIRIALNGTTVTGVTVNDVPMADADAAVNALVAEQYQIVAKENGTGVVVEFRFFLESFAESSEITHFTSVRVDEESLYYPKVALEGETIPASPNVEWPTNAIIIDRTDIEDANSDKHLPSDVKVDGQLDEVIWNDLTDFRLQGYTSHQQAVAVGNNTSAPLDLLSVGYSTSHNDPIPEHYHGTAWLCNSGNSYSGTNYKEARDGIRFKYELRTDGKYIYGAVVVYDYGDVKHNISEDYSSNGVENWLSTYAGKTYVEVNFFNTSGGYIDGSVGRKLEMIYHADPAKRSYSLTAANWASLTGETVFTYSDGTQETMTISNAFKASNGAGYLKATSHLITYEFKVPLNYLGNDVPNLDSFNVSITAYEEGMFADVKDTSGNALTGNDVRAWASATTTVKTNNTGGKMPTYGINGGLQASEWNSLLAADSHVSGMFRNNTYNNGNILTYQYNVVADYDYIYGAALMVAEENSTFKASDNLEQANLFRLWLNSGDTAGSEPYDYCASFFIDGSGETRAHLANNMASTFNQYKKVNGNFQNISNANDVVYGLDAKMRVLTVDQDMKDTAKQARFANMYQAIKAGRVAVVEFRIPLDLVGGNMDYYYPGQSSYSPQIRYYTSCSYGANNGQAIVHPIQSYAQTSPDWLVFTPASWCTTGDKVIYTDKYFDNVKIDGVRTEAFWNDFSDFVGVNSSTGYYSQVVDADDLFTYGNTIKVSRDHLYGYAILNGVPSANGDVTYTVWINNDPSYRTTATHYFSFTIDAEGNAVCKAFDYLTGESIDISNTVQFAGNVINGYTNIEFAIDTRMFDDDNTGFEYTVSMDNKINEDETVTLHYPDPRKSTDDRFNDLLITHVNPEYVKHGTANIYPYGHTATSFNGYAAFYVVFEHVNGNIYRVKAVDAEGGDGNYTAGAVPENGFMYSLYTTQTIPEHGGTDEYNPDPDRRNYLFEYYKADFKVGNFIEFTGLDLTGADKTHTKYRVVEDLLYINKIGGTFDSYSAGIITKAEDFAKHNGWAGAYIAFAPTATAGLYKVVATDTNCNGSSAGDVEFDFPTGGFVYYTYNLAISADGVETGYRNEIVSRFPVGTYVHLDGLNLKDPEVESFGYRFLDETWEGRNHHFPSADHWETSVALKIDTLGYFYPETIAIDGYLNDSGWADDAWTRVEFGVNGSLQSDLYIANKAEPFNYSYQVRTDGEYMYVAAILDVASDGRAFETIGDDGVTTLSYISVPSFRMWIKSGNEEYKDAISFTHLYDIRLGLGDESSNYHNWSDYTQTTINSIKFDIHGQTSASVDWYLTNKTTANSEHVTYSNGSMTYNDIKLRFAEHLPNGYKHPWGGNWDTVNNQATVANYINNYGDEHHSALYGETKEIMESLTSGAHTGDANWYAHTDTTGFSIANEHGVWRGTDENGFDQSLLEFKFKLSEIGCGNGETFEYFVQAAASGIKYDAPFTLFNPPTHHTPYQEVMGFSAYNLPFWIWDNSTSAKVNASTKYNMMLRNNYGPVVTLGAKINDNYDGNGSNAIRFGGLYTEEYIRRLEHNATNNYKDGYQTTDTSSNWTDRTLNGAQFDGITDYWDVAKVGIVLAATSTLKKGEDGQLDLTLETEGARHADSVGIVDWVKNSDFADYEKYAFYVTLNGIPDGAKDMKFSFRSFVDYYNADGTPTYYDRILERSFNQIESNAANKLPEEGEDVGDGNEGGNDDPGAEVVKPNHNGEVIAYIPLDNRPVNLDRGIYLAQSAGFELLVPDEELISTEINNVDTVEDDSKVGNPKALYQWLQDVENGVYGKVDLYVISLDQLLSGGLVGSRDYAGINDLDDATSAETDTDGAYYDPELKFEKDVIAYLSELTADEENKVVYFDSQMRLASTGNFNGYGDGQYTSNGVKYNNHYTFLRSGFAMQERPDVDVAAENALDLIFANYQYNVNSQYILGENIYKADGQTLNVSPNKYYTLTISGTEYAISAEYIDRYIKSRQRKLLINELLFESDVVANAEYFYVGIDDSYPGETIQTNETEWLEYMGKDIDGFSVFSGIDEIGLMSMAALVTKLYGTVSTAVRYFGPGMNYDADEYGQNTLSENMQFHIEGVGATMGASTANKNALHILVLTKKTDDNSYSSSNDADDKYVDELISALKYNIENGIPTAVVDGSAGTRKKLGRAIRDEGIDLGKLLGYSNWNTVANATGISVSNAIARYSYLKNSAEITDSSNIGFLRSLSYSYIKDIGYIIEYKATIPYGEVDSLANRMSHKDAFDTTAENLINQINASEIMVGVGEYEDIGDIYLSKELYWPWNRNFEANFKIGVNRYTAYSPSYTANFDDDVVSTEFHYSGNIWFGVRAENQEDGFLFDFGQTTTVSNARIHLYNGGSAGDGILPASKIEMFYRNASGEYVSAGEFTLDSTYDKIYYAQLELAAPVETTAVKIVITVAGSFVMLDEIDINY